MKTGKLTRGFVDMQAMYEIVTTMHCNINSICASQWKYC